MYLSFFPSFFFLHPENKFKDHWRRKEEIEKQEKNAGAKCEKNNPLKRITNERLKVSSFDQSRGQKGFKHKPLERGFTFNEPSLMRTSVFAIDACNDY